MSEVEHNCGNCEHCVTETALTKNLGEGVCRRFPPNCTIQMTGTGPLRMSGFPVVKKSDWGCAEFYPKETEDES